MPKLVKAAQAFLGGESQRHTFFEGELGMYVFVAGLILLLMGIIVGRLLRDNWHPSTIFPIVWGLGLWGGGIAHVLGFYLIESYALLLYIFGAAVFSVVGIIVEQVLRSTSRVGNEVGFFYRPLNGRRIVLFLCFLHVLVLPGVYFDLMKLSPDVVQAAYIARRSSVAGEAVLGWAASNYLQAGTMLIPLLVVCYLKKWCSASSLALIVTPWAVLILFAAGRSGLIQLLIGLLFVWITVRGRISIKAMLSIGICFLIVLVAGAIATAKVHLEPNEGGSDLLLTFYEHFSGYAFQGPILFSRYFDGDVDLGFNWGPFRSACHMLSFVGACTPDPLHLEFREFAPGMLGNVFSMYFSLYPKYGIAGVAIFLSFYSFLSAYTYFKAKAGNVYFVMLSSFFMSSIVLSIFSDQISTSWWFLIKLTIFIFLFYLFFTDRKKMARSELLSDSEA